MELTAERGGDRLGAGPLRRARRPAQTSLRPHARGRVDRARRLSRPKADLLHRVGGLHGDGAVAVSRSGRGRHQSRPDRLRATQVLGRARLARRRGADDGRSGARFAPVLGWRPSRVREFLDLASPAEQIEYWRRHLDTRRFRAATRRDPLDGVLGALYARPLLAALRTPLEGSCAAAWSEASAGIPTATTSTRARCSWATSPSAPPPPEARRIRLVHADAATCLENEPPESFDGFTLSNILDGASDAYRQRLSAAVRRAAAPGAVVGPPQLRRAAGCVADEPRRRRSVDALGNRRREAGGRAVKRVDLHRRRARRPS